MKIAQVAPLYESVPPKLYGGTERVVSWLTEELVAEGHDVTLFASGDSKTRATLVPTTPRSLRLHEGCVDMLAHHMVLLDEVRTRADEFDIVHYHIDYLHYPVSRQQSVPHVTTLHGRLDLEDLVPVYQRFSDVPVVSISDAQRTPLPQANWQATVYHGLPRNTYRCHERPGDYLVFLGRISPEKRPEAAIEIARRAGLPLKLAAKVDKKDREFFETVVKPLLEDPSSGCDYIGEVAEHEKDALLGGARALLFPIDWCEPFGLVMIEAMACGTPVIACARGSVPEVMVDGVTGYVVDDVAEAVRAVGRLSHIDRRRCRRVFEERFTAERMARDYVKVYEKLIAGNETRLMSA